MRVSLFCLRKTAISNDVLIYIVSFLIMRLNSYLDTILSKLFEASQNVPYLGLRFPEFSPSAGDQLITNL